jgi:hypothetical protein
VGLAGGRVRPWQWLDHDFVWRLLLAFGAGPALAVFQIRRNLLEAPRFEAAVQQRVGVNATFSTGFHNLLARRDLRVRLVGASLAWFLMDLAYYGNTVSSPILQAIAPSSSVLVQTPTQLAVFAVAAVPGYFVAEAMLDKIGC